MSVKNISNIQASCMMDTLPHRTALHMPSESIDQTIKERTCDWEQSKLDCSKGSKCLQSNILRPLILLRTVGRYSG